MKKTLSIVLVAMAAAFSMANLAGCPAATATPTASPTAAAGS